MTVKRLKPGKSRASYLLVAHRDFHLFVWTPLTHGDSLCGFTARWRRGRVWTHARVSLMRKNERPGTRYRQQTRTRRGVVLMRRSLTLAEVSTWKTGPGTRDVRVGTKGYVRLKVAWPGRQA